MSFSAMVSLLGVYSWKIRVLTRKALKKFAHATRNLLMQQLCHIDVACKLDELFKTTCACYKVHFYVKCFVFSYAVLKHYLYQFFVTKISCSDMACGHIYSSSKVSIWV